MQTRQVWPFTTLASTLPLVLMAGPVLAQSADAPAQSPGASAADTASPSAGATQGAQSQGSTGASAGTGQGQSPQVTNLTYPPFGWPSAAANPNNYLPSGSQPTSDINKASGGFDYAAGTQTSPGVMRGAASAAMVTEEEGAGVSAPGLYVVKQGDTLWNLCDRYFHNAWEWPRIWSYNPELQNPHWIYPGDRIRLQPSEGTDSGPSRASSTTLGGRFVGRSRTVPPNTIFLRDEGYLDDEASDVWGQISGSPDDQMLLSYGDNAYLEIPQGHEARPGLELALFRPIARSQPDDKGTMVSILGTARVDQWDPKTRIARARITESLNVIERGVKVGPLLRRFDVVPPEANRVDLEAHIVASFYPHVLYGQNQMVFIDRGEKDGLAPGNRLFAVVQGDGYRGTLKTASKFADSQIEYRGEKPAVVVPAPKVEERDKQYPLEVIGEVRVLSVRAHSAACLVTDSRREFERGQRLLARKGY